MSVATVDLFEVIKNQIGCTYISDYRVEPNYRAAAVSAMRRAELNDYSISALEDMADYLFSEKVQFRSHEDARKYFSEHA